MPKEKYKFTGEHRMRISEGQIRSWKRRKASESHIITEEERRKRIGKGIKESWERRRVLGLTSRDYLRRERIATAYDEDNIGVEIIGIQRKYPEFGTIEYLFYVRDCSGLPIVDSGVVDGGVYPYFYRKIVELPRKQLNLLKKRFQTEIGETIEKLLREAEKSEREERTRIALRLIKSG